ncbi:MAG: hypothetical protein GTO30_05875 [Acidobacteria bacterium]|nr:hypothetical protein [Acidobacteriota bacterium]NIM61187.1 hypothetical protein [Acidobacteriota bacterium]NIO58735.1 hypothetical protein [Acidobacteriota bacterium]NIQ84509.1 hypothetical protein [Acidobacteriota bacterium]NIT10467.1 hypothetical protein [Acidobacteriota bacterium]
MKNGGVWLTKAIGASVLLLFCSVANAQTAVVDTELGGTFSGTIDTAGADFVQGRFLAAGGEAVVLTVQAVPGSTLVPTAVIRDSGGTVVPGLTRVIGWMGMGNLTHVFTLPVAGTYYAEIGADSGSGGFNAHLTGSAVSSTLVTVSGVVTDGLTGNPIAGVTVTVQGSNFATTDASGAYSGQLNPGTYVFAFSAAGYTSQGQSVTVVAGTSISDLDIALLPTVPVEISASVSGDMTPGGIVTATVDINAPPTATINAITWTQTLGETASIANGDTETATVTLSSAGNYKIGLIHHLEEPLVTQDQLPPNVPIPPHGSFGGLQNRLQVVGVNPWSLEEAGLVTLEVEVDTDLGVFTEEVEIHTDLPWKVSTGLRNVPLNQAVLVQAKEHTSYDWTLAAPAGSAVTLQDATTRYPYFIPDISGLYELTLADAAEGIGGSPATLEVFAGQWRGVIVDEDMDGRPVPDTACTLCHNDMFAPDKFTDWAQTGHAEIFTTNFNSSAYWGQRCFACHTVGYDPAADNLGIDEATDYNTFLGMLGDPQPDNWSNALVNTPETARKANIQCENCHGPQGTSFTGGLAHGFAGPLGEPRVDLSSDVCAVCHGEPLRHARFQQWQLSAHANYELAIDESVSGNCSRCHTANGFLEWLPILLDDDPTTDPLANITVSWTEDEVHPQTCAACHDPHAAGTTSGINTNATVRISGDTPPLIAGFTATDVGRGAICMTCHNSRRGLRNDSVWDAFSSAEKARAPHGSAQTDMLVGQNAYFVAVDSPGGHAGLEDACVACHMESTPPPDILSYNQGGTNHTFFADRDICSDCHSPHLDPDDAQGAIQHLLDVVQDLLEDEYLALIDETINGGYTVDLNGDAVIVDAADIAEIQFGEYRGRQALTVVFNDSTVSGPHRIPDIDVVDSAMAVVDTLAAVADDDLLKSGWNWALVHNDGSRGVHNPFFANGVLIEARNALVALAGGTRIMEFDRQRPNTLSSWQNRPLKNQRGIQK